MNWVLVRNSFMVGTVTTLFSVGLGFVSCLWLAGLPARLRTIFLGAALVAMALPPFLVTNCWLHYFGHVGVWHRWLAFNIFSLSGTVWVLTLLLWPLTLLFVWGAWQRLEQAQLECDLQIRGWALLRALLIPLARDGVVLAALLTLALALSNFAVPAILQVKVLPAEMWIRFNTEFDTVGALRSAYPLLVVPLILLVWFSRREVPWPHRQLSVSGSLFRRQLGPAWFWISGVIATFLMLCSVVLPVVQILSTPRTWSELPAAFAAGHGAAWNSVWYSGAAAMLIVAIPLCARLLFKRKDHGRPRIYNKGARFGISVAVLAGWLAFLLPGVLLGIALIHLFNHTWSAALYQGAGIVVLAFAIRYLMVGWQAVKVAGRRIDRDLLDAAVLEGASRLQILRHVEWPQTARSILVAWYVVFLLCLWDVESMILVVPPGGETLALRIFNLLHYGHNTQVNALCLSLLGIALLPLIAAQFLGLVVRQGRRWLKPLKPVTASALCAALVTGVAAICLLTSCAPNPAATGLTSRLFDGVQIIGTRGVGVGQLNKPRSVAIDALDNLYVVDMTGRVQKFSSNGVFQLLWQMPQTDLGKPKGMGRDRDGNILLVEPHYSRVNVFSPMGKLLDQWGNRGTNAGQLSTPRAIAMNSHREIFVSEYQEIERVQKFVFDAAPPEVNSRTSPRYVAGFGYAGMSVGEFNRPEGLCVDLQDRVYVADSCNHRIQVFDSNGHFLRAYGKAGQGPGELSYPYDICVDKEGRQYVCEFGNSRIQVFDAHDKSIEIIGGPGVAPGRFSNPWGVALDSAENLYVADSQNHRVQKLLRKK